MIGKLETRIIVVYIKCVHNKYAILRGVNIHSLVCINNTLYTQQYLCFGKHLMVGEKTDKCKTCFRFLSYQAFIDERNTFLIYSYSRSHFTWLCGYIVRIALSCRLFLYLGAWYYHLQCSTKCLYRNFVFSHAWLIPSAFSLIIWPH